MISGSAHSQRFYNWYLCIWVCWTDIFCACFLTKKSGSWLFRYLKVGSCAILVHMMLSLQLPLQKKKRPWAYPCLSHLYFSDTPCHIIILKGLYLQDKNSSSLPVSRIGQDHLSNPLSSKLWIYSMLLLLFSRIRVTMRKPNYVLLQLLHKRVYISICRHAHSPLKWHPAWLVYCEIKETSIIYRSCKCQAQQFPPLWSMLG